MKIELVDPAPMPPKVVVITLELEEAKALERELFAFDHKTSDPSCKLWDALSDVVGME